MKPINRTLYEALQSAFGAVKIANPGEGIKAVIRTDAITGRRRLDRGRTVFGEYYQVCCPWCGDQRHRLWVNHAYGSIIDGVKLSRQIKCYNENCEQEPGFWEWFDAQLSPYTRDARPLRAASVPVTEVQPKVIGYPQNTTTLDMLYDEHPARVYIRDIRKFDPDVLARSWSVSWCDSLEPYYRIPNRILIPSYSTTKDSGIKLVGWQARYLNPFPLSDVPPDKDTKKYINVSGFRKSQHLFNAWRVEKAPLVVVTEGPFDAMRVGPELGIALFGKKASENQKRTIWDLWGSRQCPIVVLLDPDAQEDSDNLYAEFSRYTKNIHRITLPDGKDAADMQQHELLDMIARTIPRDTGLLEGL